MDVFIFSIFSLIQIRYFVYREKLIDIDGNFVIAFFHPPMTHEEFVVLKLTLFAATASLSFILMLSNYFVYENPNLEKRLHRKMHLEIKKMLKKKKYDHR